MAAPPQSNSDCATYGTCRAAGGALLTTLRLRSGSVIVAQAVLATDSTATIHLLECTTDQLSA
jgi:hypothetical protein